MHNYKISKFTDTISQLNFPHYSTMLEEIDVYGELKNTIQQPKDLNELNNVIADF